MTVVDRPRGISWSGVLAAFSACIILFDTVLTLGLGLDWALVGLFRLSLATEYLLGAAVVASALWSAWWLFRQAYRAELELQRQEAEVGRSSARGQARVHGTRR